jgi:hypothetical protein
MAATQVFWKLVEGGTWVELDAAHYNILEGNGRIELKESAFTVLPTDKRKYNIRVDVDLFERVASTPAELIQTIQKTIGCMDTNSGGLGTGEFLYLAAGMQIGLFSKDGPVTGDAEADAPYDWGVKKEDLPPTDNSGFRYPDHHEVIDDATCDVGNAEIDVITAEVSDTSYFNGGFIGAFSYIGIDSNLIFTDVDGGPDLSVGIPVYGGSVEISGVSPIISFPEWFQSLPDGTEIIDACLEITMAGIQKYEFNIEFHNVFGEEDENSFTVKISDEFPEIGFTLLGKRVDGMWESIGSAIDVTSLSPGQHVKSGLQRRIQCKGLAELALARPKKYVKYSLFPGFMNDGGASESVSSFKNDYAGILWGIWSSWQSNNKFGDGTLYTGKWHWMFYDYLHLGAFTVQYKLPNGFLGSLRLQQVPLPSMS